MGVVMFLSYSEYLEHTRQADSRTAWIAWKVEICGMNTKEATIAAYDKEWGWAPIDKTMKE